MTIMVFEKLLQKLETTIDLQLSAVFFAGQSQFPISDCKMDSIESDKGDVSSAKAVLLGALAPGVNGPTWVTLKSTFLMLGLCLAVMLGLAFSSSDSSLMLHVAFLVLICVSLFLLLTWFLAETGLVSVEHQMREIGLAQSDNLETSRKNK
ncbi:uncharacterized protein LOC114734126 [Neltuma alba]|uniref:uncharacterized protein LOC114734126 n=1 Tax=Neltuma alba TaxID=207710 RepID=UPI0010A4539F|nr:uncharacterized protein LOC114734126 [Prosopis alba]